MDNLIKNPPKGYEFIVENDTKRKDMIEKLKGNQYTRFFYKAIIKKEGRTKASRYIINKWPKNWKT